MNTLPVLDDIVARLRVRLPGLHVAYFPDNPDTFTLTHPTGAVLLSYSRSTYGTSESSGAVMQPQTMHFVATVVLRQLNGQHGAVDALDSVRQALGGWRPKNCLRPVWLVDDTFLGEIQGLWQYALKFATQSFFIQDDNPEESGAPLVGVVPDNVDVKPEVTP
ncbi:TPA: Gp37 family protein [Salmonella enterica subsp. enterica serovar Blitta]|nr:Gp37 family protein [Salmonella enterica subsp. enterica serovar Blitta]